MRTIARIALTALGPLSLGLHTAAHSQSWGDIGRIITAPITVPGQVIVNTVQGRDPAAPIRQTTQSMGNVVAGTVSAAESVHNFVANVPRQAIDQSFGGDWSKAFDALTAGERYTNEMAFTQGRFLGGCLRGQPCNINQIVALPVAASLRDAYKACIRFGQPLPPQAIQLLSRVVSMNILVNARIVQGARPDMTVPGFINSGYEVTGSGHAVTIGNLMIFSRQLTANDWVWLLHELHHTEQYASKSPDVLESVNGFAVDYVQFWGNMENEAQSTAEARFSQLLASCQQFGC